MTVAMHYTPNHTSQFLTYIFWPDITTEMLKFCRVTKVRCSFYCWYTFLILDNFKLFEFSAAILEKGLLEIFPILYVLSSTNKCFFLAILAVKN